MVFKNVKKDPTHEGNFIVDIGEVPKKVFTIPDVAADIAEHEAAIKDLKKLKKDAEALNASS